MRLKERIYAIEQIGNLGAAKPRCVFLGDMASGSNWYYYPGLHDMYEEYLKVYLTNMKCLLEIP